MNKDRQRAPIEPDGQRILIVLPNWVGDVVWATPALSSIRRRFANSKITFLMRPYVQGVIGGAGLMDETITWHVKKTKAARRQGMLQLAARLRRDRFDLAVLLTNSFRSALVTRLAGIKRRIGYDRDGRGLLLTDRLLAPRRNGKFLPIPMTKYHSGIAAYLGCDDFGPALTLCTTPEDESAVAARLAELDLRDGKPLVVMNPGAAYGSAKCWFPERFAQVADALVERLEANIVVVCGPKEREIARHIGRFMRKPAAICDDPIIPIAQLKALLKRATLLITNDTGARPIAMALNVPIVTIFGSTDPAWTEINYPRERKVMIPVDCGPCMKRTCPLSHHKCMDGVTGRMVLDAVDHLLKAQVPERPTV